MHIVLADILGIKDVHTYFTLDFKTNKSLSIYCQDVQNLYKFSILFKVYNKMIYYYNGSFICFIGNYATPSALLYSEALSCQGIGNKAIHQCLKPSVPVYICSNNPPP